MNSKSRIWLLTLLGGLAFGLTVGQILRFESRTAPVSDRKTTTARTPGPRQIADPPAAPHPKRPLPANPGASLFGPPLDPPAPAPLPPPIAAPPAPEDPLAHYVYTGNATIGEQSMATIKDDRTGTETLYVPGDMLGGYKIVSIEPDQITLDLHGLKRTIHPPGSFNPIPLAGAAPRDVRPNPGNLTSYRDQTNQSFYFQVTGSTAGTIWGSGGIYTDDSELATAAVHAGALRPGESGVVHVTVLPGYDHYAGATSNGITSQSYAQWQGSYRVDRL